MGTQFHLPWVEQTKRPSLSAGKAFPAAQVFPPVMQDRCLPRLREHIRLRGDAVPFAVPLIAHQMPEPPTSPPTVPPPKPPGPEVDPPDVKDPPSPATNPVPVREPPAMPPPVMN
jgi:hypothetical protein